MPRIHMAERLHTWLRYDVLRWVGCDGVIGEVCEDEDIGDWGWEVFSGEMHPNMVWGW